MASIMWDVIAVTSATIDQCSQFKIELEKRQARGQIDKDTIVLSIADPGEKNVGSGASTLNGIFVIGEHLSASHNKTFIDSDLVMNSRILLLHLGGRTQWVPPVNLCGKAMNFLPATDNDSDLVTPFDLLLNNLNKLLKKIPAGIVVSSTESLINLEDDTNISEASFSLGVSIVTILAPLESALNHGVCKVDKNTNVIENIIHRGSKEFLQSQDAILEDNQVHLYTSLLYFGKNIVEQLLHLPFYPPLDTCTYLGVDNGAVPLHFGLYSDILLCMAKGITYDDYINVDIDENVKMARKLLWKHLRGITLQAVPWKGNYQYLRTCEDYLNFVFDTKNVDQTVFPLGKFAPNAHSFISTFDEANSNPLHPIKDAIVINSLLIGDGKIGKNTLLENCELLDGYEIGEGSFISGIRSSNRVTIGDKLCVQQVCVSNLFDVVVTLGIYDSLDSHYAEGTYLNIPFIDWMTQNNLKIEDLWQKEDSQKNYPVNMSGSFGGLKPIEISMTKPKTLRHAKLFIAHSRIQNGNMFNFEKEFKLDQWRKEKRVSIEDITCSIGDITQEFDFRRDLTFRIDMKIVENVLVYGKDICLLPIFARCARNIPINITLANMDEIAQKSVSYFRKNSSTTQNLIKPPRIGNIVSTMSDCLAAYAKNKGGLRSGPASNVTWDSAFKKLYAGNFEEGLFELAVERNKWLSSPDSIIRAARHYEGACQAITKRMVETASTTFEAISKENQVPLGEWVEVALPCRIDLAGGWSDTPPITYEHGGAVVNVAITVNGQKPIKARARRIESPVLIFNVEEHVVTCSQLSDLSDYSRPFAPAALLKACIVCMNILNFETPLDQQLINLGGGLELHTKSDLPTGSGLGTSSILAGAIFEAISIAFKMKYSPTSLIHLILKAEQMLTTGGGWQDQVGGLLPGIKISTAEAKIPVNVNYSLIEVPKSFLRQLETHIILIYTGRTRLARDLLQDVIRRWYSKTEEILKVTDGLVQNALRMKQAVIDHDISEIGKQLSQFWEYKKIMATGAEPVEVKQMLEILKPYIYGASLTGAGGGGFLCLITKEPNMKEKIEKVLQTESKKSSTLAFYDVAIYE